MSRNDDIERSLLDRATHDLLNPVSSLLGLGETLRSRGGELDDATLRSFGASIARQATRLQAMVRDLRRATFLAREDPPVDAAEVVVGEVVGALAGERVRADVPDGLSVRADRDLLADALQRLVSNALEYSKGEVVVRAGRDGVAWIEVADTGTGFTEEGLARAFDVFAAGANARNERGSGLGLGLFIARRLVEAHGGRLSARSTPGGGSVFRIELPA